jgi:hypothetical protein
MRRRRPNRQVVVGGLVEDNVKTGGVPKKLALLVARKAGLMESVVAPAPAEQLARHKVMADGCPDGLTMLLTYTYVRRSWAMLHNLSTRPSELQPTAHVVCIDPRHTHTARIQAERCQDESPDAWRGVSLSLGAAGA